MANRDDKNNSTVLWRRTVEAVLDAGASPAEAMDAANIMVQAYLHQRARSDARTNERLSAAQARAGGAGGEARD